VNRNIGKKVHQEDRKIEKKENENPFDNLEQVILGEDAMESSEDPFSSPEAFFSPPKEVQKMVPKEIDVNYK